MALDPDQWIGLLGLLVLAAALLFPRQPGAPDEKQDAVGPAPVRSPLPSEEPLDRLYPGP